MNILKIDSVSVQSAILFLNLQRYFRASNPFLTRRTAPKDEQFFRASKLSEHPLQMMRITIVLIALMGFTTNADKNLRDPELPPVVETRNFQREEVLVNSEYPILDYIPEEAPPKKAKACWRNAEPRGRGSLPDRSSKQCPENQEKSMGLCYPLCGDKHVGFGPLCMDDCKATVYKSSSILFCCETDEFCTELMEDISSTLPKAMAQLIIDIAKNPDDFGKVMRDFRAILASSMKLRLPMCATVEFPFLGVDFQMVEDQVAELTEEEGEEADVSTGEIIEDFAQETLDVEPNPLVSVT